jgi:hypothetical protein
MSEEEFRAWRFVKTRRYGKPSQDINPEYALFCRRTRAQWERDNVEFFHPQDGTWRSERPELSENQQLRWRKKGTPCTPVEKPK